jgi:hypothetical protein
MGLWLQGKRDEEKKKEKRSRNNINDSNISFK